MTGWLLDTNVLSDIRRPRPEPKVLTFIAAQPLESFYVSTVTLAEIRFGIELLPEVARRTALNDWLARKVRPMFEQRVLPISEDVMFKWRLMVEEGRKAGHTFSQPDLRTPSIMELWLKASEMMRQLGISFAMVAISISDATPEPSSIAPL